jgi:hypothetical protein
MSGRRGQVVDAVRPRVCGCAAAGCCARGRALPTPRGQVHHGQCLAAVHVLAAQRANGSTGTTRIPPLCRAHRRDEGFRPLREALAQNRSSRCSTSASSKSAASIDRRASRRVLARQDRRVRRHHLAADQSPRLGGSAAATSRMQSRRVSSALLSGRSVTVPSRSGRSNFGRGDGWPADSRSRVVPADGRGQDVVARPPGPDVVRLQQVDDRSTSANVRSSTLRLV